MRAPFAALALDDVAEAADTDVGAVALVAHEVVTVRPDVATPVLTARVVGAALPVNDGDAFARACGTDN